jgi:hypothetical protein
MLEGVREMKYSIDYSPYPSERGGTFSVWAESQVGELQVSSQLAEFSTRKEAEQYLLYIHFTGKTTID